MYVLKLILVLFAEQVLKTWQLNYLCCLVKVTLPSKTVKG